MSVNEILALYRIANPRCDVCKRIVARYERTLAMCDRDRGHLEGCVLALGNRSRQSQSSPRT